MLEDLNSLDKIDKYENFHDPKSNTSSALDVERTITHEQVGKIYESRWKLIQSIYLDREFRETTPKAGSRTGAQLLNDLNVQLERLQSFAKNGVPVDVDGNPLTVDSRKYKFTQNLAAHVDSLSRIMQALGLHLNSSGATDAVFVAPTAAQVDALKHLQDLPEVERLIRDALEASKVEGVSTQYLLKTSYIDKGNELIFGKLEALKNKLSINKEILATLTKAQELKNMIKPEERDSKIRTSDTGGSLEGILEEAERKYKDPLGLEIDYGTDGTREEIINRLVKGNDSIAAKTLEHLTSLLAATANKSTSVPIDDAILKGAVIKTSTAINTTSVQIDGLSLINGIIPAGERFTIAGTTDDGKKQIYTVKADAVITASTTTPGKGSVTLSITSALKEAYSAGAKLGVITKTFDGATGHSAVTAPTGEIHINGFGTDPAIIASGTSFAIAGHAGTTFKLTQDVAITAATMNLTSFLDPAPTSTVNYSGAITFENKVNTFSKKVTLSTASQKEVFLTIDDAILKGAAIADSNATKDATSIKIDGLSSISGGIAAGEKFTIQGAGDGQTHIYTVAEDAIITPSAVAGKGEVTLKISSPLKQDYDNDAKIGVIQKTIEAAAITLPPVTSNPLAGATYHSVVAGAIVLDNLTAISGNVNAGERFQFGTHPQIYTVQATAAIGQSTVTQGKGAVSLFIDPAPNYIVPYGTAITRLAPQLPLDGAQFKEAPQSTMIFDGLDDSSGTLLKGDTFTIAGDTTTYTVLSNAYITPSTTTPGKGSVKLSVTPAIQAPPAAGATITKTSSVDNLTGSGYVGVITEPGSLQGFVSFISPKPPGSIIKKNETFTISGTTPATTYTVQADAVVQSVNGVNAIALLLQPALNPVPPPPSPSGPTAFVTRVAAAPSSSLGSFKESITDSITLKNLTDSSGTINAGEKFTIAGDTTNTVYTVNSTKTANAGEVTLNIYPGLKSVPVPTDGTVINRFSPPGKFEVQASISTGGNLFVKGFGNGPGIIASGTTFRITGNSTVYKLTQDLPITGDVINLKDFITPKPAANATFTGEISFVNNTNTFSKIVPISTLTLDVTTAEAERGGKINLEGMIERNRITAGSMEERLIRVYNDLPRPTSQVTVKGKLTEALVKNTLDKTTSILAAIGTTIRKIQTDSNYTAGNIMGIIEKSAHERWGALHVPKVTTLSGWLNKITELKVDLENNKNALINPSSNAKADVGVMKGALAFRQLSRVFGFILSDKNSKTEKEVKDEFEQDDLSHFFDPINNDAADSMMMIRNNGIGFISHDVIGVIPTLDPGSFTNLDEQNDETMIKVGKDDEKDTGLKLFGIWNAATSFKDLPAIEDILDDEKLATPSFNFQGEQVDFANNYFLTIKSSIERELEEGIKNFDNENEYKEYTIDLSKLQIEMPLNVRPIVKLPYINTEGKDVVTSKDVDQPDFDIETWILDNHGAKSSTGKSLAGDIQSHITEAITESQNVNDSEKEKLRETMLLFEEFYKSATTLLAKISQIIEKMASKAAG